MLRAARGFRYVSPTEIYGRGGPRGPCTSVAVYLNGGFFPGGFEALDNMVSIREVLAIEAYPDISFAPFQWRFNRTVDETQSTIGKSVKKPSTPCALVAFWTRQ